MNLLFAHVVLLTYPILVFLMFQRMPRAQAAATAIVVGSMMLPEQIAFDLPAIPPMDKEYITYLSVLAAALVYHRPAIMRSKPGQGLEIVFVLMVLANIGTAMMNSSPLFDEGKLEDALGPYWILAQSLDDFLLIIIPFFLGRALFTSLDDLYVFMRTLVIGAALYTGLILFEVVMAIPFRSWHLGRLLYGLNIWGQVRWGQVQPIVFFENALALANFMAGALIASAGIVSAKLPLPRLLPNRGFPRVSARLARIAIAAGLVMTRNVAGNVAGLSLMFAHIFLRTRLVMIVGLTLTGLAVAYPVLRIVDLFPWEALVEFASDIDAERARSFAGRFHEEEHVLGQLEDRLYLGWGTYNRIPGAETFGEGEVGLDGWVTIRVGVAGVIGFFLYYLMFLVPVVRTAFRVGRADRAGAALMAALVCMIAARLLDLIINGWWNCLPVFWAGILMGVSGNLRIGDRVAGAGGKPRAKRASASPARPREQPPASSKSPAPPKSREAAPSRPADTHERRTGVQDRTAGRLAKERPASLGALLQEESEKDSGDRGAE